MSSKRKIIDVNEDVVKILGKEAIDSGTNFKNWVENTLTYLAFHSKHHEGKPDIVGTPGGLIEICQKIRDKQKT